MKINKPKEFSSSFHRPSKAELSFPASLTIYESYFWMQINFYYSCIVIFKLLNYLIGTSLQWADATFAKDSSFPESEFMFIIQTCCCPYCYASARASIKYLALSWGLKMWPCGPFPVCCPGKL